MNIEFGFSWQGLVAFVLTMIPNIGFFINKTQSLKSDNIKKISILDIFEHAMQAIFVAMLVFIVHKKAVDYMSPYMFAALLFLLIYWITWVFYFKGIKNKAVLIILAVAPVAYFILVEIWLMNYLAIIPTSAFGVIHLIVTVREFKAK